MFMCVCVCVCESGALVHLERALEIARVDRDRVYLGLQLAFLLFETSDDSHCGPEAVASLVCVCPCVSGCVSMVGVCVPGVREGGKERVSEGERKRESARARANPGECMRWRVRVYVCMCVLARACQVERRQRGQELLEATQRLMADQTLEGDKGWLECCCSCLRAQVLRF